MTALSRGGAPERELCVERAKPVCERGAATPTYDGGGNLTYDGAFPYAYDAENRLTTVRQGGAGVASYAYDAQGRRKQTSAGTTQTVYVTVGAWAAKSAPTWKQE